MKMGARVCEDTGSFYSQPRLRFWDQTVIQDKEKTQKACLIQINHLYLQHKYINRMIYRLKMALN